MDRLDRLDVDVDVGMGGCVSSLLPYSGIKISV